METGKVSSSMEERIFNLTFLPKKKQTLLNLHLKMLSWVCV